MSKKNAILLTLSQIALGGIAGLVTGWVSLFIFEDLIGRVVSAYMQHGFWVGLFLLVSFGAAYGSAVVGAGEGVRLAGRWFGVDIDRKKAYQGAFLGAPTIVALMSLINIHWGEIIAPNLLIYILLPIARLIAFIVSLPILVLTEWLKIRPELLYIVAVPVGAILGYRLDAKPVPAEPEG